MDNLLGLAGSLGASGFQSEARDLINQANNRTQELDRANAAQNILGRGEENHRAQQVAPNVGKSDRVVRREAAANDRPDAVADIFNGDNGQVDDVEAPNNAGAVNPNVRLLSEMDSLSKAVKEFCFDAVKQKKEKLDSAVKDLRISMNNVEHLNALQRAINECKDRDGNVDFGGKEKAIEILDKVREMGIDGINLPEGKLFFTSQQREDLVEGLKTFCEDLKMQNELKRNDLSKLMNEHQEIYKMAFAIMKTLDEIMKKIINNINPK